MGRSAGTGASAGRHGPVRAAAGWSTERGVTVVELLCTLGLAGLILLIGMSASIERADDGRVRAAAQDVRGMLARARTEAVKRNLSCRFALNTATGAMQVLDTRNTSSTSDDLVIAQGQLPTRVTMGMPDGSAPVTLTVASSPVTVRYADFAQSGLVDGGQIGLRCGSAFCRVLVYDAGGLRVERWTGSQWRNE